MRKSTRWRPAVLSSGGWQVVCGPGLLARAARSPGLDRGLPEPPRGVGSETSPFTASGCNSSTEDVLDGARRAPVKCETRFGPSPDLI